MTIPELWQKLVGPGTPENPTPVVTVASATSIDTTVATGNLIRITGTTDIANIKPPYPGFQGPLNFLFDGASPPDFVSGGSPAAGFFGVALTKSMVRYEVVTLFLDNSTGLWYPSMT